MLKLPAKLPRPFNYFWRNEHRVRFWFEDNISSPDLEMTFRQNSEAKEWKRPNSKPDPMPVVALPYYELNVSWRAKIRIYIWNQGQMAEILQTTLPNMFCRMKIFRLKSHMRIPLDQILVVVQKMATKQGQGFSWITNVAVHWCRYAPLDYNTVFKMPRGNFQPQFIFILCRVIDFMND